MGAGKSAGSGGRRIICLFRGGSLCIRSSHFSQVPPHSAAEGRSSMDGNAQNAKFATPRPQKAGIIFERAAVDLGFHTGASLTLRQGRALHDRGGSWHDAPGLRYRDIPIGFTAECEQADLARHRMFFPPTHCSRIVSSAACLMAKLCCFSIEFNRFRRAHPGSVRMRSRRFCGTRQALLLSPAHSLRISSAPRSVSAVICALAASGPVRFGKCLSDVTRLPLVC